MNASCHVDLGSLLKTADSKVLPGKVLSVPLPEGKGNVLEDERIRILHRPKQGP
jgi:hypothetical protein